MKVIYFNGKDYSKEPWLKDIIYQFFKVKKECPFYNDFLYGNFYYLGEYLPYSLTNYYYSLKSFFFEGELYVRLAFYKDFYFKHHDFEIISKDEYYTKKVESFHQSY